MSRPTVAVAQDLLDPAAVVGVYPHATATAEHVAELTCRLAHGRRIDDRHQVLEIVHQHPVKQVLVAIMQFSQLDILVHRLVQTSQNWQNRAACFVHGVDPRRQQTIEPELEPLILREGRALVQQRITDQLVTAHAPPVPVCRGWESAIGISTRELSFQYLDPEIRIIFRRWRSS